MRTVTPLRAGVISIQDLEEAVRQPVAVLCEEHDVVVYLVENVNACHGRFLLKRSCYEAITVYRVTGVFGGMLGWRHAGVLRMGTRKAPS